MIYFGTYFKKLKKNAVQFLSLQEAGRQRALLSAVLRDLTVTPELGVTLMEPTGTTPKTTSRSQHILRCFPFGPQLHTGLCSSDEKASLLITDAR